MSDLSQILDAIGQGDGLAAERLWPLVYDELRRLATRKLAHEKPGQTLDATALVHEAYLRLVGAERPWDSRRHFFAAAAEAMRRILVESARRKRSHKRGGDLDRRELDPSAIAAPEVTDEMLALDEALARLETTDPAIEELVKLRYFAGLTIPEAAAALGVSPRTADSYWAYAKAFLRAELQEEDR